MSKIFAEVLFRKISGFYYTQNKQKCFGMKKQKKLHLKTPENSSRIIFRGSSEWLQPKYFSKQKHVQSRRQWRTRMVSVNDTQVTL